MIGEQALNILTAAQSIFEYGLIAAAGDGRTATGAHRRPPTGRRSTRWSRSSVLLAAIGGAVADMADADAGRPSLIVITILFVASLGYAWMRQRRGAALVPIEEGHELMLGAEGESL